MFIKWYLLLPIFTRCGVYSSIVNRQDEISRDDKFSSSLRIFAAKTMKALNDENPGQNVVFSPYSLHLALSMLYAGSGSETQNELGALLNYSLTDSPDIQEAHRSNLVLYKEEKSRLNTTVALGNAIYMDTRQNVKPSYQTTLRNTFLSEVKQEDFQNTSNAVKNINHWIKEKTGGKIENLLSEASFDSSTDFVLINTVYFNGPWLFPFEASLTRDDTFLGYTENITVPMMHLEQFLATKNMKEKGYRATILPYQGEEFAMILLSHMNETVMNSITTDQLGDMNIMDLYNELEPRHVKSTILKMPKFTVNMKQSFKNTFKKLGATRMFGPDTSDFSGISDDQISVGEIFHEAKVEVSESGTEAAAATSIQLDLRSSAEVVTLNSPFVLVIADLVRNIPLFMAKIVNPMFVEPEQIDETADISGKTSSIQNPNQIQNASPTTSNNQILEDSAIKGCSCVHGKCIEGGVCICQSGYVGQFCEIPETDQAMCYYENNEEVVYDHQRAALDKILFPCSSNA